MKLISATLLPLVLLTNSATAQPTFQCLSPAQSQTPQLAPAPACKTDKSKNAEHNLKTCDTMWNEKLKAHNGEVEQTTAYRSYYDKWKDLPAQRPPKLSIPDLTRASYRQYMYNCLREITEVCPANAPDQN